MAVASPHLTTTLFFNFRPVRNSKISPRMTSSSSPSRSMDSQKPSKRVIVCGGGVIGICTAYFLSKSGAAVTVIEKSSIASAASGKAGGFLALDWCDGGPLSNLARTSFNLHRSLSEDLDGPQSYGYRPLATLSLSINESDGSKSPSTGNSILPEWVDGPCKNPRVIGTEENTAQVHPKMFTRVLAERAVERYGLEVVIGKVESVVVEDGAATAVVVAAADNGGSRRLLAADAVVLALGPWSGRFEMLSGLFRVYGLKAHSIILEPKERSVIGPHALFLSYRLAQGGKALDPEVYPRPTGEVYICGMSAEAEVPEDPEEIVGNPESIAVLKRVASNVSSHLREGDAEVKTEQACFLPCTDDSIPVIGELPGIKGCYVATGHSCWGILNGPATGAAMAELVLDGRASIVNLSPFSPARFVGRSKRFL